MEKHWRFQTNFKMSKTHHMFCACDAISIFLIASGWLHVYPVRGTLPERIFCLRHKLCLCFNLLRKWQWQNKGLHMLSLCRKHLSENTFSSEHPLCWHPSCSHPHACQTHFQIDDRKLQKKKNNNRSLSILTTLTKPKVKKKKWRRYSLQSYTYFQAHQNLFVCCFSAWASWHHYCSMSPRSCPCHTHFHQSLCVFSIQYTRRVRRMKDLQKQTKQKLSCLPIVTTLSKAKAKHLTSMTKDKTKNFFHALSHQTDVSQSASSFWN